MVTSKLVLLNKPIASGFKVRLKYNFSDGSSVVISLKAVSEDDANILLGDMESSVLARKIAYDAGEAIENDIDTAHKTAPLVAVYKAWAIRGMLEEDPLEAHKYLSKVVDKILALGLTLQQVADAFEVPLSQINAMRDRWLYIKSKESELTAYFIVKRDM